MWVPLTRLSLGISLIALTSTVLVLSDVDRRNPEARKIARIAILQHANSPVLDDGVAGMIQALEQAGFRNGSTAVINKYNATGDMAIGNAIATQITNGEYDLVLTSSTPSMQAVARANRDGRTIHVFGVTADPFSAGIGLDRSDPLRHPRHIVGQGVLLPVIDSFRIAKRMFPGLRPSASPGTRRSRTQWSLRKWPVRRVASSGSPFWRPTSTARQACSMP